MLIAKGTYRSKKFDGAVSAICVAIAISKFIRSFEFVITRATSKMIGVIEFTHGFHKLTLDGLQT
tara:strand:- start:455 stop:649 length:195 start_codon:yes stop_codon:yes gene_type:complete